MKRLSLSNKDLFLGYFKYYLERLIKKGKKEYVYIYKCYYKMFWCGCNLMND